MLGERIASQYEVIRAIVSGYSPCCGGGAHHVDVLQHVRIEELPALLDLVEQPVQVGECLDPPFGLSLGGWNACRKFKTTLAERWIQTLTCAGGFATAPTLTEWRSSSTPSAGRRTARTEHVSAHSYSRDSPRGLQL